jgi:hypothetical protein
MIMVMNAIVDAVVDVSTKPAAMALRAHFIAVTDTLTRTEVQRRAANQDKLISMCRQALKFYLLTWLTSLVGFEAIFSIWGRFIGSK